MTLGEPQIGQLLFLLLLSLAVAAVAYECVAGPRRRDRRATLGRMTALSAAKPGAGTEALVRARPGRSAPRGIPFLGDPEMALIRADVSLSAPAFLGACGAITLVVGLIGSAVLSPLMAVPLALGLGFFLPVAILKTRSRKRTEAFVTQLPDALDLMMRGLRVGHPVSVTIGNVARTMPAPIGPEFRVLAEQIAHGDYLTDAFADLAERIGQEDMDYLSVSLAIQHGTGGNLADMLDTLAKVIRDRIMMRRRVKAISSEGRISALILSAMPVLIFAATSITAPDYYGGVSDDPLYLPIACIIVALVVGNGLALRKLVSFQI